jgi:hypothetical protein
MSRPLTVAPERDGRTYGAAWRKRRARYARKVGWRCERCGTSEGRLELHHIDPLGTDEDSNLELLCAAHHREEEAERCVVVNVHKHTLDQALEMVRRRYAAEPRDQMVTD